MLTARAGAAATTIPGVGPATAATLMAEIGDIRRFDDVDQVAALSGVHPAEKSSGRKGAREGPAGTWPRPGPLHPCGPLPDRGLRHQAQPGSRQHYAKKRAAGRSPMNAIGHAWAKLWTWSGRVALGP